MFESLRRDGPKGSAFLGLYMDWVVARVAEQILVQHWSREYT
jgi:hypothetical protein